MTGLRLGAQDYITKPFHGGELVQRLRIHADLVSRSLIGKGRNHVRGLHESSDLEMRTDRITVAQHQLLSMAGSIIKEHASAGLTLDMVVSMLRVPKAQLQRAFRSGYGITVSGYIRRIYMHKAAYMLARTSTNIIDVAATVGYSGAANFATAFRLYYGINPSAVRRGRMVPPIGGCGDRSPRER